MAEPKTKPTSRSVTAYLNGVADKEKRDDCFALVKLMKAVTKSPPKMWGPAIVGFGNHHYVYASGREGDWPIAAFSPRAQNLTIYLMPGFGDYAAALMKKLGKHKTGKSCLYFSRLADLDQPTLRELVERSMKHAKSGKL